MSSNYRHLSQRFGLNPPLFKALAEASDEPSLQRLADSLKLTPGQLRGSASFYDFLDDSSRRQRHFVCQGTACRANRSAQGVQETYPDAGTAMCMGYCYQGAGLLERQADGRRTTGSLIEGVRQQPAMPVYNFAGTPILTAPVEAVAALYEVAQKRRDDILRELEDSKLRGRGGAGFAFAFKCRATAEAEVDEKYIVCNADEGDPGAFSDRYLLEQQPHKVLAGMFAAGLATGARQGLLYIRWEYPEAIERVRQAIGEFQALPGQLRDGFQFRIVEGAGSYVCGEETALLSSIEGLRPEVRVRPPYPAQYGLWGKPTLLSNVETFANIPWILQQGGKAYAAIGTDSSKGTKLVSLDSQFKRPGLYEVDFGQSFATLIHEQAGGWRVPVKALQVGGPLGSVIPVQQVATLTIDFEDFARAGFALGHAGIIAIPETYLMIELMLHLFDYMADESCGKCVPCRLGTAKGRQLLEDSLGGSPIDQSLFQELLTLLETGSLCALGGGLPLPVRNMLAHFAEELAPYFSAGA